MLSRRSILSGMLGSLACLVPSVRLLGRLKESFPGHAIKVGTEFQITCHVDHADVDFEDLRRAIDSVNSQPIYDFAAETLILHGVHWSRGIKTNGEPGLDVLVYSVRHKPTGWSDDYTRTDFNRFPSTAANDQARMAATPFVYGSWFRDSA